MRAGTWRPVYGPNDHDLLALDRHTPSKPRESKTRKVSGETFVQGFSQHILPPRLQKIRYNGWMSSNSRHDLDAIRWVVYIVLGWTCTLTYADKKLAL
jgi:Putative transposase